MQLFTDNVSCTTLYTVPKAELTLYIMYLMQAAPISHAQSARGQQVRPSKQVHNAYTVQ